MSQGVSLITNRALPIILFFFCANLITAQDHHKLLKVLPDPHSIKSAPDWAQLMYSDDPDVSEVIDQYNKYYKQNPFIKNIHTQNYKRWARAAEKHLTEKAKIRFKTQSEEEVYFEKLKAKASQKSMMNTWESIGPFETYKNGTTTPYSNHANVYSIDQALYNSQKLVCGTESGGVFLTTDKGANWNLVSKNEVFSNGITAVALHPTQQNTIYISGNSRIYRSTDNGASWSENFFVGDGVDEIKFDPNDDMHIFLAAANGLYESIDGGSNWTQIFSDRIWDIDFHPTNSNIIYILKSNPSLVKTEFYKSTDNGSSWTNMTNGWYVPQVISEAVENGGKIGVSPNDPNRVYAALIGSSKAGDNGWIGIYRSDNEGNAWTLPSGQIGGPYAPINTMPWNAAAYSSGYHQGYYNFDMEVSPTNADLLWFGTVRLNESNDGGVSYLSIGAANSTRLSDIHADIQAIHLDGNDIWIASDGGINYSSDNLQSHASAKYGIIASNFWGFGAGWNEDVLVGGKYHNGNTAIHENYGPGYSHNVGGVEEATGYVNPLNNRNAYFNQYWSGYTVSKLIPDNLGGTATDLNPINIIPNESYFTSYSSGIYHYPLYSDHMIAGKDSIIWKSFDGGATWEVMHDFGAGRVLELEICRSNPDIIYAVFQPGGGYWDWCEVHKTTDGGNSWSQLTQVPSNNRRRFQITTNPSDANEVWVAAVHGGNGQKIYRSLNGGVSWINRSDAILNGQDVVDIKYHGGSNGLVYALTNEGFYYVENSGWTDYSSGLPTIINPLAIDLFYRDQKVRIATSGRGIWQIDMPQNFAPIAHAITESDTIYCGRDTIQLESHSIIDQANASWHWAIAPAPAFIDNNTIRNPKILLGTAGDYSVTLTATDGSGNSSVAVHNNMLHLENNCSIDTIQGLALNLDNAPEYVQLPHFGVTTNNFTMTAWIKPNGIQSDYSSILMNDASAAGINFRESNNTLGYHWPGGEWWWDSNLVVPTNEWSHIALVATPNGITLYLNGIGVTHNIAISPVLLETIKIGSYKGWTSRNYNGEIDEVAIWNRSLSEIEIRSYRHLTKESLLTDQDFVAYYQFNQGGSTVLDKIGSRHGSINNGVTYTVCNAPFGKGGSDSHFVGNAGVYNFSNANAIIEYGSGSYPNGDVYVTRINGLPKPPTDNNENLNSYWVINNYGNSGFTAITHLSLDDPFTSPSSGATNNSSAYTLISRSENNHHNIWTDECTLSNTNSEYYVFSACDFGGEGQFFIKSDCEASAFVTMDYINGEVQTISVADFIQANNTISGGSIIEYKAGNYVELLPQFEVGFGSQFTIKIEDCNN